MPELLVGLCRRLRTGGVGVDRAGCGILTLHPQIVSQEVAWRADEDRATTLNYTPQMMEDPANRQGPYFDLGLSRRTYKRYLLEQGGAGEGMPLLRRLCAEGYSEYFGFFHATGGAGAITPFARRIGLVPCVVGSFATKKPGGFNEAEIACFKAISKPLALAAKARANFETGARLLGIYVGRSSGAQVLDGRITRGDYERIPCGIWLSDLRRSSRLVAEMPLEDYIALLNRSFDVAAGAVMGAGGEVLKFMGDAVLGIFRTDHPESDIGMRERALAAALKTVENTRALDVPGGPLEAGIALHIGEVMYGNVGSDERLDFTVIGRAVNEAARLEALTKELGRPVLASASFAAPIRDRFAFAGAHLVPGFKEKFETYVPRD